MFKGKGRGSDRVEAACAAGAGCRDFAKVRGVWRVEAFRNGKLLWEDVNHNLIVHLGLDEFLNATLANQGATAAWYVGLKDNAGSIVAADTMASRAWGEITSYDEATRQAWTPNGAASSQVVTNSSAKATFTISGGSVDIWGYFLTSSAVKGGTAGKLFSAGNFSAGKKTLSGGDILYVTASFGMADDGV